MKRVALFLLIGGALGCPPAATLPSGCGKDVDCKGARICVAHACVDPPPKRALDAGAPLDGGPADAGAVDGGAADMSVVELPKPIGASQMFHVDAMHSGRSRFKAPTAQPKETMHVATGGVVVSSPAIADDGTLVFGSHDKSVYAVDGGGNIKWRHPTGDLVWGAPALGPGGVVYAGSDDDHVYAFDLADGNVRWTFTAGPCRVATGVGPEGARCDVDGVTVAADGTIYASADGLYALAHRRQAQVEVLARRHPLRGHARRRPRRHRLRRLLRRRALRHRPRRAEALGLPRRRRRRQLALGHAPTASSTSAATTTSSTRSAPAARCAGPSPPAARFAARPPSPPTAPSTSAASTARSTPCARAASSPGASAPPIASSARRSSTPPATSSSAREDDRLYAISPDGKLLWSLLLDGDVDATPAIGPDGTIYVGNDDRALHALR